MDDALDNGIKGVQCKTCGKVVYLEYDGTETCECGLCSIYRKNGTERIYGALKAIVRVVWKDGKWTNYE